ncbi:MAG: efflux RND transporter periplasmic adaptor subunit [Verrucomicrobiales bacterium]|nr:efflux RND transporter periplasmic adaptor subunit [Verrucomicrobiales bacterium]
MKIYSISLYSVIVALVLGFCGGVIAQDIHLDATAVSNLNLKYAPVRSGGVSKTLRASGTVRLNEKRVFEVTPRIDGIVVGDPLSLGDVVKKGDTLCKLQSGELANLISIYVAAEEAMTFASAAALQEKKLAEKNLSSTEQVREKELLLTQAISSHAKALQPLKLLEFDEGTIHRFLADVHGSDYTSLNITAPEGGEIIERDLRRGAAVAHDDALFTIADLSELWVDFHAALRDVEKLSKGDEVFVESSVTEKRRGAKVFYISPIADEQSRTVMIRALLDNSDRAWRPGNPVNIRISGENSGGERVSVPAGAVVDFEGGKAVFVKSDDDVFLPVSVEVGDSDGERIEIVSGVSAGQTVVSENAAQLKGHLAMTVGE